MLSNRIQLHGNWNSTTFGIFDELQYTPISLKRSKFILKGSFSLLSQQSMVNAPLITSSLGRKLNRPARKRRYFTLESAITARLRDVPRKLHHGILFAPPLISRLITALCLFGQLSRATTHMFPRKSRPHAPTTKNLWATGPGEGGVLPYTTYTGMCRPTGSWFWSSRFRTGYPFQRRFLERGIIFRTHESSSTLDDYEEAFIWCISRTNKEISFKKNRAISIYKLSRAEYKKLAHF